MTKSRARAASFAAIFTLLSFATSCGRKVVEEKPIADFSVSVGSVERRDPAFNSIAPPSAKIQKIASGFEFTEGPIYMPDGYLLFSDVVGNAIYKWQPEGGATVFKKPSGYDGKDAPKGSFIGSNGMTVDKSGRLVICEHGNHRIERLEATGDYKTLVDNFEGKRLNSPNDLIYKSDGALYFTDPPYGLPKGDDDPKKELKFNGVFRLGPDGKLTAIIKDLTRPNGIAFSPDEKFLYIANSDEKHKVWMRYDVQPDGTVANGKVFFDVTAEKADGLPDGMKVDVNGNLYCAGPGGIWVFSPDGRHIGTIKPPETPANCHWGKDAETNAQAPIGNQEYATTLYITARTGLYRIPLGVVGVRP
jgi:gluconolactonase